MRISQNMVYDPYLRTLGDIQSRRVKEQERISTGRDINDISDDPKRTVNIKQLQTIINRNNFYMDNMEEAFGELSIVSEQMDAMSENIMNIRQFALDSTTVGNHANLASIGVAVKGLMEDLVKLSNVDFNGKYLFSGTMTTPESLAAASATGNDKPFEIVKDTATATNPSGLRVVFNGNNNERIINKDAVTTEVISYKAEDLYGANGTEVFDSIIGLYNLVTYNPDGTVRAENDIFTTGDIDKINTYQKQLADFYQKVNNVSSQNGTRINRLDSLKTQMTTETTRLKDILSAQSDTDVAKAALNLSREENALQYTLQVGARLMQNSLFDFLG